MKKIQIVFISILLILTACRKDKELTGDIFVPTGGGELVASQLMGQVIDEEGFPLRNALVQFQQATMLTNEDGVFSFAQMDLESNGQLLSVEKDGFFTNYKKIIPTPDDTFLKIGMVTKSDPTGTFSAANGGVVEKPDGEKITFSPNSIRLENGGDYQGEVFVYTHHFNPETDYFNETVPGDLSAINKSGEAVQLATYSMILVELFSVTGEKLNLKENTTATVTFPIKGAAATNAPSTIPLWSLDENTGTWVEELQATKQGDYYIGEVDHFSFWNCDAPFDLVKLQGTIIDQNGNPVPFTSVGIHLEGSSPARYSTTNSAGIFAGNVPKDEVLVLDVYSNNECQSSIYSENIGPFSTDQSLNITVELEESNSILITGAVKNCMGEAVDVGYAVVSISPASRNIVPIDSDGNFSFPMINCTNFLPTAYGVDLQNSAKSPPVIIIDAGQTTEDVGDLVACISVEEFISVSVDGAPFLYFDFGRVQLNDNVLTIENQANFSGSMMDYVKLIITNPAVGTNLIDLIQVNTSGSTNLMCNNNNSAFQCSENMSLEITELNAVTDGYMAGVATGSLWQNNTLVPTIIEFKVKLDYVSSNYPLRIWNDLNQNGLQDTAEPGMSGAVVYYGFEATDGNLFGGEGRVGENGIYNIPLSELNTGSASLFFPSGYVTTLQDQGMDENLDSDFPQGISSGQVDVTFPIQDLATTNLLDLGVHIE